MIRHDAPYCCNTPVWYILFLFLLYPLFLPSARSGHSLAAGNEVAKAGWVEVLLQAGRLNHSSSPFPNSLRWLLLNFFKVGFKPSWLSAVR